MLMNCWEANCYLDSIKIDKGFVVLSTLKKKKKQITNLRSMKFDLSNLKCR